MTAPYVKRLSGAMLFAVAAQLCATASVRAETAPNASPESAAACVAKSKLSPVYKVAKQRFPFAANGALAALAGECLKDAELAERQAAFDKAQSALAYAQKHSDQFANVIDALTKAVARADAEREAALATAGQKLDGLTALLGTMTERDKVLVEEVTGQLRTEGLVTSNSSLELRAVAVLNKALVAHAAHPAAPPSARSVAVVGKPDRPQATLAVAPSEPDRDYAPDEIGRILDEAARASKVDPKRLRQVANVESGMDPQAEGKDRVTGHTVSIGLMQVTPTTLFLILENHEKEMRERLANCCKAAMAWMNGDHSKASRKAVIAEMKNPELSANAGALYLQEGHGDYLYHVSPAMQAVIRSEPKTSTLSALELARRNGISDRVVIGNPDVFGPVDIRRQGKQVFIVNDRSWTAAKVISHNNAKFGIVEPKPKAAVTVVGKKPKGTRAHHATLTPNRPAFHVAAADIGFIKPGL